MSTKIIQDLNSVANIVGGLGLSIAEAQRAMNLDYLDAVERLVVLATALQKQAPAAGGAAKNISDDNAKFVQGFIAQFAPTRYQYGETTLKVRLDLAQTLNASGGAGVGVGFGAVAVNASAAFAYGSQYQAAAEVSTIIQAVPADATFDFIAGLGTRAAAANAEKLALPARATDIDKSTAETSGRIIDKLLGIETPKPALTPATT